METNVQKKEHFNQVCVIHGLVIKDNKEDHTEDFVKTFLEELGTRIQFLEQINTKPDLDSKGKLVKETGGRTDTFFAVHEDDVGKFSVPRFKWGVRWIEDVLAKGNYRSPIYPKRVFDYCTWNKEALANNKEINNPGSIHYRSEEDEKY